MIDSVATLDLGVILRRGKPWRKISPLDFSEVSAGELSRGPTQRAVCEISVLDTA